MGSLLYIFFLYKLLYFLELLIPRCSTWTRRFSKYCSDGTSRLKVVFFFFFGSTVINLCAKLHFQVSKGVMFPYFSLGLLKNNCLQSLVAKVSSFGSDLTLLHSISNFCELLGSPVNLVCRQPEKKCKCMNSPPLPYAMRKWVSHGNQPLAVQATSPWVFFQL